MADEQDFTLDTARSAARDDRLHEWVDGFLASPGSDNAVLGEQLRREYTLWFGPVEVPFDRLHRLAGPEDLGLLPEVPGPRTVTVTVNLVDPETLPIAELGARGYRVRAFANAQAASSPCADVLVPPQLAANTDWFDRVVAGRTVCMITPDNASSMRIAQTLGYVPLRDAHIEGETVLLMTRKGPPV